jgi:EAL domain-containing protein (putative c-di-GMP-specific phosphodiesterase class I)
MQQKEGELPVIRELTRAVEHMDEFHLVFQPQYKMELHTIVGVEALIRWKHPERGWIRPDLFIPAAEQAGLIGQIGQWVIKEASRQYMEWKQSGLRLRVSVNLSPEQLKEEGIADFVDSTLEESGMDPSFLTLELTEGAPLYESRHAISRLHRLRDLGCSIAIDDFGTGYSSLKYLMDIPVQYVKLDRIFIHNLGENTRSRSIVRSMIELAGQLDFQIIAEGVESSRDYDLLLAMGCHEIQGYHISPPLEAQYIPDIVAKYSCCQSLVGQAIDSMKK